MAFATFNAQARQSEIERRMKLLGCCVFVETVPTKSETQNRKLGTTPPKTPKFQVSTREKLRDLTSCRSLRELRPLRLLACLGFRV